MVKLVLILPEDPLWIPLVGTTLSLHQRVETGRENERQTTWSLHYLVDVQRVQKQPCGIMHIVVCARADTGTVCPGAFNGYNGIARYHLTCPFEEGKPREYRLPWQPVIICSKGAD